ncbi:MAG: (2Fe-2S) ferredoxin domain-containing protein [Chloroflexota bacterium]
MKACVSTQLLVSHFSFPYTMDKPRLRAYLCCGPNCGPKGAQALVDFLAAEVVRNGLDNEISVAATGCQAHCESGPTMVVYPGPIYYQMIDRGRLSRIVAEHFIEGEPIKEFFWTGIRRRIIPGGQSQVRPMPMPAQHTHSTPPRPEHEPRPKPKPPVREVDDFKW